MDAPLLLAGLAMGLAASPHCALMCGAPCAGLTAGSRRDGAGFHLGRTAGYMAGGALAAGSMALLGAWSQAAPALRPLWTALHLALLALGLWWLATGTSPAWLRRSDSTTIRVVRGRRPAWRASAAGLAWVAWPCGVLQAALLLSALASTPLGGALVMAAFALGSAPALAAAPWALALWRKHRARAGGPVQALDLRISGGAIVLASGWALTHGLWQRLAAFCGF